MFLERRSLNQGLARPAPAATRTKSRYSAVQRLAATLDQEPTTFRRGSEMPESWYAILFAPIAREKHAAAGRPPPDRRLPAATARYAIGMFAGRTHEIHHSLENRRHGNAASRR